MRGTARVETRTVGAEVADPCWRRSAALGDPATIAPPLVVAGVKIDSGGNAPPVAVLREIRVRVSYQPKSDLESVEMVGFRLENFGDEKAGRAALTIFPIRAVGAVDPVARSPKAPPPKAALAGRDAPRRIRSHHPQGIKNTSSPAGNVGERARR
jgi:hypothetical protein